MVVESAFCEVERLYFIQSIDYILETADQIEYAFDSVIWKKGLTIAAICS